jgi:Transglycosylase SLT domain
MDISGVRYAPQIEAAATAHGLDPKLLAAVAAQETGGPGASSGQNIVGDGGHGHGVFQIDDRSWDFAKTPAAMDPGQNADMAASILADNLHRYGGDVHAALSAYNTGSPTATGTTTRWGDGTTLGYADSVMRHYGDLGGDTASQLLADRGETSQSVNSLATYASGAGQAAGSVASPGSSAVQEPEMPPLMASFTPAPAIQYTSPGQQAATNAGAEGDKALGDLVDASDDSSDSGDDG